MRTKEWEEKQVWLTNLVSTMMQQMRVREVAGVHNMSPKQLWEYFADKIRSRVRKMSRGRMGEIACLGTAKGNIHAGTSFWEVREEKGFTPGNEGEGIVHAVAVTTITARMYDLLLAEKFQMMRDLTGGKPLFRSVSKG